MSNEIRPKSRNKSRTKEHNDKSVKKNAENKIQISLKESKEKKSKTTTYNRIATINDRKANESIRKEELQKLMKKNDEEIYRNKIVAIERNLHPLNSIDKLRQPLSSSSKTSKSNSTSTAKQYPEKSTISKLERLKSKRNESERKLDTKYVSEEGNYDTIRKLRNDKSSSNHVIDNSIDKTKRLPLVTKSLKSNYQNLKLSKLSSSEITPSSKIPPTSTRHIDEYNYEDDFEEYSDDFEEETDIDSDKSDSSKRERNIGKSKRNKQNFETTKNSTISKVGTSSKNALIDAANDESFINSPLLHRIMNPRRSNANVQPLQIQSISHPYSMQRKIDFTNATKINWERILEVEQRYKILKNLIGMEIVQIDLLDHHSIGSYDFYIQMFGNKDCAQVQTQTGDDDLDRYVQTEEVEKETIWTQIPYSDSQGWGIVNISNDINHHECFNIDDSEIELFKINHFEMEKFRKFISTAGQVFIDLMQSSPNHATKLSFEYRTSFMFSIGYDKFSLGNLVNAFYVEQTSNEDINNRSIIVEFDICIPHSPQKILICHSEVRCLCTSPDGNSAIFIGLNDGSCMAYDLRESNSLFTTKLQWHENGETYPLRTAAYDTSFKAIINKEFDEIDQFPVVEINIVPSNINNPETYQLVSVNEVGIVIIWAIINEETNRIIDHDDLGLRPGAQLKMRQISTIRPDGVLFSHLNSSQKVIVNCMTVVPTNRAQFLLGTNRGIIASFVSNKSIKLIGPRMYRNDFDIAAEVTCISFSVESTFFLAGFSSGHISLYEISNVQPVFTIESPKQARQSILQVFFSPSNPTIFYTIHRNGLFLVWDLAKNKKPESIVDLHLKDGFEVAIAESWSYTTSELNINLLAISFSNGEMQLHGLSKLLVNSDSKSENKSLASIVKEYKDL
ncbi:Cytoplasmic dynein 2 intermediate chain [Dirofilaria immitis]